MMLRVEELSRYYETNFRLVAIEKVFSLTELDEMLPYERDIYIDLMNRHIEEENKSKQK